MIGKIILYTLCVTTYIGTALDYADALDVDLNSKCDPLDTIIVLLWPIVAFGHFIYLITCGFDSLVEKVTNHSSRDNKTQ